MYPLSQEETVAMETYVSESLRQVYIRPSTSPASSSFFSVKEGGLRPCIDYRGLNSITVGYSYPRPLIATAIESFHGTCFFTKLDLRSAYNVVRIWEGDEWKTAFSATSGHYEYLVMPYGLKNAPAVFRSFVDEILRDLHGRVWWIISMTFWSIPLNAPRMCLWCARYLGDCWSMTCTSRLRNA